MAGLTKSRTAKNPNIQRFSLQFGSESEIQCPTRLTLESGMHSIVMDEKCRYFVATSSDVYCPTTLKFMSFRLPTGRAFFGRTTVYNAAKYDAFTSTNVTIEHKTNGISDMVKVSTRS